MAVSKVRPRLWRGSFLMRVRRFEGSKLEGSLADDRFVREKHRAGSAVVSTNLRVLVPPPAPTFDSAIERVSSHAVEDTKSFAWKPRTPKSVEN
ncbi:hypothetical protein E3N88_12118 [Mikania micrantha]|uniref:Uncharacterized protein n=1 Tax=Mikania micrantha TaxID=192012 RepID=A0A5N6P4R1_9ASTR|nr:hypothetical protein E3N88_12118 [Mikania micrantha]